VWPGLQLGRWWVWVWVGLGVRVRVRVGSIAVADGGQRGDGGEPCGEAARDRGGHSRDRA
jgi:hypothetical protein